MKINDIYLPSSEIRANPVHVEYKTPHEPTSLLHISLSVKKINTYTFIERRTFP